MKTINVKTAKEEFHRKGDEIGSDLQSQRPRQTPSQCKANTR